MLATVVAADSASTVIKKYSVFIYSEAEPHAMYAIYKHTRKFHVLQYIYIYIYIYIILFGDSDENKKLADDLCASNMPFPCML